MEGMDFNFPTEFMFQTHEENHPPNLLPSCTPPQFQGTSPLLLRRSMSFSGIERSEQLLVNGDIDDMSDDGSQLGEKKKRLNLEQVRTLEKSFEFGNKLEPERKIQLARALNLQPRQVAIWFQNRRARWKTKQMERDYEVLKRQFDAIKSDNNALQTQNKKLHAELLALKSRESTRSGHINLNKETKSTCWSNASENSCNNLDATTARTPLATTPLATTDTSLYSHLITNNNKQFFPSQIGPTIAAQLLQSPSRSDLQSRKIDRTAHDESFSNLISGIGDDQPGFWAWPEQQHFH